MFRKQPIVSSHGNLNHGLKVNDPDPVYINHVRQLRCNLQGSSANDLISPATNKRKSNKRINTNKAAIYEVSLEIRRQRLRRNKLQRCLEDKADAVAVHLKEGNNAAAVDAMRHLLFLQAEKDWTLQAIHKLNKLVEQLGQSPTIIEFDDRYHLAAIQRIVSRPSSFASKLRDNDLMLKEAENCLRHVWIHQ